MLNQFEINQNFFKNQFPIFKKIKIFYHESNPSRYNS